MQTTPAIRNTHELEPRPRVAYWPGVDQRQGFGNLAERGLDGLRIPYSLVCGVRRSEPSACRRPLLQDRLQRHLRRVALPHRFHRLEQRLALPGEQERVRLVCG